MKIYFNKYHGAGNDFIIIDNRKHIINPSDYSFFKWLCDRHMGVGADGVMLLGEREGYDFEMRYYNSDGKESTMCGNGGRCIVAYAKKLGIIESKARFIAPDGVHYARVEGEIVSLGMTDVEPPEIVNGNHYLNTGSPHYIVPVPDVSKVDVESAGRRLRHSDAFAPGGVNVNFVEYDGDRIIVRTYERGVEAETLSCGTGVTAAAISYKWGKGQGKQSVKISTSGGNLEVSFIAEENRITSVCLKGPAAFVFEGSIER